jgi:hypothetical protein
MVLARDLDGKAWFYHIGGGLPEAAAGILASDAWLNWSSDGHFGYVGQNHKTHAQVFRVDLSSGKRQQILTLGPDLMG